MAADSLVFFVNGNKVVVHAVDPEWTLAFYLRTKLRLTGTKVSCSEGGCGACTVVISRYDRDQDKILHYSVNACLYPVCAAHGLAVTTVEGIGSIKNMHPIQRQLAEAHGSQCGFCTPGFVMSMYALMRNHPKPTQKQVETAFQGNLCRCTGYRPILDGAKEVIKTCSLGSQCCKNNPATTDESDKENKPSQFGLPDSSQETVFPSELKVNHQKYHRSSLTFRGKTVTWYRPASLTELLTLMAKHPQAKIVSGNTRIGLETRFEDQVYPSLICPSMIDELKTMKWNDQGLVVGAVVTIAKLADTASQIIETKPAHKTKGIAAIRDMLRWFGGQQIRNVSTVGGSIAAAGANSDLNVLLMTIGCRVKLQSKDTSREINLDQSFFIGERRTVLQRGEIIISITVPFTDKNEYVYAYKQARRRDCDTAIVNAGMMVRFVPGTDLVEDLSLCYGGMADRTVKAKTAAVHAHRRNWDEDLLHDVCSWLETDLPLDASAPGGSVQYRRTLTTSFFYKFFLSVLVDLHAAGVVDTEIPRGLKIATQPSQDKPKSSSQVYHKVSPDGYEAVGQPLVHSNAYKQATGEAVYIDDVPVREDEVFLVLVRSSKAHARILSVDTAEALSVQGVISYIDHKDIPGPKSFGLLDADEEIFATDEVHCVGQTIGAIVAVDRATAKRAAKLVDVQYEELPHIITLEEAVAKESWLTPPKTLESGDIDEAFEHAKVVVEGEQRMRGQEHLYMEPHCCLVVPTGEDDGVQIYASTQMHSELQTQAARILNIASNKVEVRVKRIGGGFGGKMTRTLLVVLPSVVAAHKLTRPVRCVLDRDEDMSMSGNRHPFYAKYKIGAKADGTVVAFDCQLYSNGGCTADLSDLVIATASAHITNAYNIPNVRVNGRSCRTNLPSNTAFRGFGAPQGMLMCESAMDKLAQKLGIPANEVRRINLLQEGDITRHKTEARMVKMEHCSLQRCWDDCLEQSDFNARLRLVEQFNKGNKTKKRGISVIPTKFSAGFNLEIFDQGAALVNVYKDGSVLLTHGGVEMGQGLHVKMIQVASQVLQIPASKIYTNDVNTHAVPNTSLTAASRSSDLNGGAVMDACQKLMRRLAPIREANPDGTWEEWVINAWLQRISLSATGFHELGARTDGDDVRTNAYFTMGVACTEVEVDCLTGDHKVLRTDIVMDVGNSLNPAIDIGQIEGAFMQGYGLFMMEELRHSPDGVLLTRGPTTYKVPAAGDVPTELNVTLLKDAPNPKAVYSSKAVGEPPLFLASSVFFAVKDAIRSHRAEHQVCTEFELLSPASAENIRLACVDRFSKQFKLRSTPSERAWDVVA